MKTVGAKTVSLMILTIYEQFVKILVESHTKTHFMCIRKKHENLATASSSVSENPALENQA